MTSVSGCTLVRNAVKLKYPLEASILTYYPLCDEVVISYDPSTDDGTEAFIMDLSRRYPKIRPIPSPWNMKNHVDGTEITIQSNVAVEACSSDWILYVQADEAIHEKDYDRIRESINDTRLNGVLFARRSYMGTLDQEIPDYYARNLLRLYRNGKGCVVGDGMTCGFYQNIIPSIPREQLRMYNYSRLGSREEVLLRSRSRDRFHHSTTEAIDENLKLEFQQKVAPCDPTAHPIAIRQWYAGTAPAQPIEKTAAFPITLACLMGNGERENLAPFFWQFRGWPGEIVILDDETQNGSPAISSHLIKEVLKMDDSRFTIIRRSLNGDFAAARNALQDAAKAPWVLASDLDERWDSGLLANIVGLTSQLDRDGKVLCGFPCANFVDSVLVNDVPDTEWTESGLLRANPRTTWPPQDPQIHYRLLRKSERWEGRIHERPAGLATSPDRSVILRDYWILHNKSFQRQRSGDSLYRSLGQIRGMPCNDTGGESVLTLREAILSEAVRRLPQRAIRVVETGTLRDPSPAARLGDGWSTLCLAKLLAGRGYEDSHLMSIDLVPEFIEISKRTVPEALHRWVTWICGDSVSTIKSLEVPTIDLLYLDSGDDPSLIMSEFEAAHDRLSELSVVVVDDTGPSHQGPQGKGSIVIPALRDRGWKIEKFDDDRCHMVMMSPNSRKDIRDQWARPEGMKTEGVFRKG